MIHWCVYAFFVLFAAELMWRKKMSGMLLYCFFFCLVVRNVHKVLILWMLLNKMLFNRDGALFQSVFAQFNTYSKQAKVPQEEKIG